MFEGPCPKSKIKREVGKEGAREERKVDQWIENPKPLVIELSSDSGQVFSYFLALENS